MKWTKRSLLELIAVLAMTAVVFALAILQYKWTQAIGSVEQARMEGALDASVKNFSQEFSYDFDRLCEGFELGPAKPGSPAEVLAIDRYTSWIKTTSRPDFVSGVYLFSVRPDRQPMLESLDLDSKRFRESSWPEALAPLRRATEQHASQISPSISGQDANSQAWTLYEEIPALTRPILEVSAPSGAKATSQVTGLLIIDLNGSFLRRVYLPELVDRHFGQLDFEVAIRSARDPYEALYVSTPDFPIATAAPEAAVNLLDSVSEEARRRGHPGVQTSSPNRQWQLVVRGPSAPLAAAVGSLRKRNLAISLGLLSVLAISLILVFSVARRAERFAKLQMEFVAGVSHELCTPLAVISSAVENLADGIVDNPQQVAEYAAILKDQGGRIEQLLDQVLLFASGGAQSSGYDLRKLDLAAVVAQSLAISEPILRDAGFTAEQIEQDDLPQVHADPVAVGKCLENLISNAVKYAGQERWLAVRTMLVNGDQPPELQVRVEDKGIGIPPEDLPHIFEPFYRVQTVRDGQIRGVGLGLHLVKRMMEGMGGRASVTSSIGKGSCFVLHFPVDEATPEKPALEKSETRAKVHLRCQQKY